MNYEDIKTQTYWITSTNERTFPDSDFRRVFAIVRKNVITNLLTKVPEWNFSTDRIYTDILPATEEGQAGYNGEYPFPVDALDIARIDIAYDGRNYKKAELYFINDNDMSEETAEEMSRVATKENPKVLIYRGTYSIRPLHDSLVLEGIRIKASVDIQDIDDTAEIPDILSSFHDIYTYEMAVMYGLKYPEKMKQLWVDKRTEEVFKLEKYYQDRWKRNIELKTKQEDYA